MSRAVRSRAVRLAAACGLVGAVAFGVGYAVAASSSGSCNVNASGGFINCLTFFGPTYETVKANHAAGTPYRLQLVRPVDGSTWGPWSFGDLSYHSIPLAVSNNLTEQVDNQGTGNPSNYYVAMGN